MFMRSIFVAGWFAIAFSLCAQEKDSIHVEITNMGKEVNSAFADFAPVVSADGSLLIFTSKRPVSDKEIRKGKESSEHILSSEFNQKNNSRTPAAMLSSNVNIRIR